MACTSSISIDLLGTMGDIILQTLVRRQDDGDQDSKLVQPASQLSPPSSSLPSSPTSVPSLSRTATQPGIQTQNSLWNLTRATIPTRSNSNFHPMQTVPKGAPAGTLTITQPPQLSTSYYKIAPSQFITFGWSFSHVLITPSHLTVSAVCENGNTYPVGPTDGIIPGNATSVVWDTYSYQTSHPNSPLAQAKYNLKIWGDHGPNSLHLSGLLAPNDALHFALYTPQPYIPVGSGWVCAGCSGAMSPYVSHPALAGILVTLLVTLLSGALSIIPVHPEL